MEFRVIDAAVTSEAVTRTKLTVSLQCVDNRFNRPTLAFFPEHENQGEQSRGQTAIGILSEACGIVGLNDASQFIDCVISNGIIERIKDVLNPRRHVDARQLAPPQRSHSTKRHVYVISCVNSSPSLCKIGIAMSPEKRLRQLSTSSPHELRLEASFEAHFAPSVEAKAHEHFASVRRNGEWFELPASKAIEFVNRTITEGRA